ncbi:MAG: exodeoxyribonuclease VII small subunit [Muribaculaceae bacterium]|jgi:exodeoxyribonuclease VII small subunit|nr:exodeoxyribonuclease VII small subunit [Muribaculaceae bacterium]MBQ4139047.1 exodeoxyribonuclease VII small subunit [Muribaculaceae bacterium]
MEQELTQLTYSQAIAELEQIVQKMQSADCTIDNLSDYTARSLQLLKVCKSKLTETDEKLKKILAELDEEKQ